MNNIEKAKLKKDLLSDNNSKGKQHRVSKMYLNRYKKSYGPNVSLKKYLQETQDWEIFSENSVKNNKGEEWTEEYEQLLGRVESLGAEAYDKVVSMLEDTFSGGHGDITPNGVYYKDIKPSLTLFLIILWVKQDAIAAKEIFGSFEEEEYVDYLVGLVDAFTNKEWFIFHSEEIIFPTSTMPVIAYDHLVKDVAHLLDKNIVDKVSSSSYYKNIFLSEFVILPLTKNDILVITSREHWNNYIPTFEFPCKVTQNSISIEHHQNLKNIPNNTIKIFTDDIFPLSIWELDEPKITMNPLYPISPAYMCKRIVDFYLQTKNCHILYASATGKFGQKEKEELTKNFTTLSNIKIDWNFMSLDREILKGNKYVPDFNKKIIIRWRGRKGSPYSQKLGYNIVLN